MRDFIRSSKVLESTWLNRRGRLTTYHMSPNKLGLRMNIMKWLDGSGQYTVSLITGDGTHKSFSKFFAVNCTDHNVNDVRNEALDMAAEMLSELNGGLQQIAKGL